MKTLHTKSPCCQGKVYHFGNRRRQCAICGRTWRIRQKKKGRKRYRVNKDLLKRVLLEGNTLTQEMRKGYSSLSVLRYRFRKSLEWLTSQNRHYSFQSQQLVLLADGLWFRFKKEDWVLFLMAIKPANNNKATLLDPVLLKGKESYENWSAAIDSIPNETKERIVAFVSDNFRPAKRLAREHHWIHQLCHFHLIAQLQVRRGRRKKVLSGRNIREEIYQYIRESLETTDEQRLAFLKSQLQKSSNASDCPRKLRMITNEFLRAINLYRAYLLYSDLNLPTTTNAIESTGRMIRKVMSTISTPQALHFWATSLIRLHSEITCNGKHFQPN